MATLLPTSPSSQTPVLTVNDEGHVAQCQQITADFDQFLRALPDLTGSHAVALRQERFDTILNRLSQVQAQHPEFELSITPVQFEQLVATGAGRDFLASLMASSQMQDVCKQLLKPDAPQPLLTPRTLVPLLSDDRGMEFLTLLEQRVGLHRFGDLPHVLRENPLSQEKLTGVSDRLNQTLSNVKALKSSQENDFQQKISLLRQGQGKTAFTRFDPKRSSDHLSLSEIQEITLYASSARYLQGIRQPHRLDEPEPRTHDVRGAWEHLIDCIHSEPEWFAGNASSMAQNGSLSQAILTATSAELEACVQGIAKNQALLKIFCTRHGDLFDEMCRQCESAAIALPNPEDFSHIDGEWLNAMLIDRQGRSSAIKEKILYPATEKAIRTISPTALSALSSDALRALNSPDGLRNVINCLNRQQIQGLFNNFSPMWEHFYSRKEFKKDDPKLSIDILQSLSPYECGAALVIKETTRGCGRLTYTSRLIKDLTPSQRDVFLAMRENNIHLRLENHPQPTAATVQIDRNTCKRWPLDPNPDITQADLAHHDQSAPNEFIVRRS